MKQTDGFAECDARTKFEEMSWGLKNNMNTRLSMITYRYVSPKGTIMDVKFEPDSDNGSAVCGNDWTNVYRGLEFPITYWELVRDGWTKV